MSACSQCGTPANPNDRFCNICGTPIARQGAPNTPGPGAPSPFAPPQPPQPSPGPGAYAPQALAATAAAAALQCQMGHEIPAGGSYCTQGHPLVLDPLQYARQAYPPQGYAPPQQAYAPPPQGYAPQQQAYAPPAQAYAPPQQAYAPPPQGYAPQQQAYAPPQGYAPPAGMGAPMPVAPSAPPPQPQPRVADLPQDAPAKVLRGFLVAYGTNPSGEFWPLTGGRHTLGRLGAGDGIDISVQDPTISSRHGALEVDAASGSIVVYDTGSTNGTFVNDEHIGQNGRRELRDGDRLRLGGFTMIVKIVGRI